MRAERAAPVAYSLKAPWVQAWRELVVHAQAGSRAAMTRLHEKYAPMVHAILLARVPAQRADDLVQDVFVQAMTRLGGLRKPGAFGGLRSPGRR